MKLDWYADDILERCANRHKLNAHMHVRYDPYGTSRFEDATDDLACNYDVVCAYDSTSNKYNVTRKYGQLDEIEIAALLQKIQDEEGA